MNTLELKEGQTYICTKSDKRWWTVGKEYKVFLYSDSEPAIKDDHGVDWHSSYLSYLDTSNIQFKLKEEQQKVTLDEPQKIKVPAFVEEHIEYSDSANWSLLESIQEMNGNVGSRELANWFEAHSEDYARAWLDGYEVEEETKWIVCYSTMYLKSPLETGQIESVEITPKKELAYHFKSYKEAKQQTSLIGGAVEQVEV